MGIVNHDERTILFSKVNNFRKWSNITIHAKDSIRYHHCFVGVDALSLFQYTAQAGHIFVWIDFARRPIQTNTVNDTGVIQFITDNQIAFLQEGRDNTQVCRVARLESK